MRYIESHTKNFPPTLDEIVTKDNWFKSKHKLRGYCHNSELAPGRTIWRGDQGPSKLAYANNQLDLTEIIMNNGENVLSYLDRTDTDAFLVIHDGKVLYENYFNGYKHYELHAMNSATKSFVGLMVNVLANQGLLVTDKKVSFYVPELEGTGLGNGTIQQLLDMQVPVKYMEAGPEMPIGRGTPIYIATGSMPKPDNYKGPENLYDFMCSSEIDVEPGTTFFYENSQTEALGWVIKRLTGKNVAELIQEVIWSKIGAEENALMLLDNIGTDIASGGMRATLRDLGRFGEMMLNDGYYNGHQVLPESVIKEIHKGGDQEIFAKSAHRFLAGFSYHNQWWISNDQFGGYSARGRFDQHVYIAPKAKTVIVKLSSHLPRLEKEPNIFEAIGMVL